MSNQALMVVLMFVFVFVFVFVITTSHNKNPLGILMQFIYPVLLLAATSSLFGTNIIGQTTVLWQPELTTYRISF